MKKLLVIMAVLLVSVPASSQTLMDYVLAVRGDTLVIKDYSDMGGQANSLTNAMLLDTVAVPAGRVYELRVNGTYPAVNNPTTQRPTVIIGADPTILVNNDNAASAPPVICGSTFEGGSNTGGMNVGHDLTVKNCAIVPADAAGDLGWTFFATNAGDSRVTLENDMFERTRWVFTSAFNPGLSWFFKDCYFVNMNGQPCCRNGGVYDGFSVQDTMWVENCTHVMAQGYMYKLREYPFERIVFNHNTFVNISGINFLDLGYQVSMSTTNNIFVNCNLQSYCVSDTVNPGEQDLDMLPMGLVNVRAFPDTGVSWDQWRNLPRQYLFEGNVVYWDPRLADITSTLSAANVNGTSNWLDQMIIMNSRTEGMFNDNTAYPFLALGPNYTEVPSFTDPKDLLTTQVDNLKTFTIDTAPVASPALLPDWRVVNIGPDFYIYSDWPIPVDLSYSNATLLNGATGGFPVGDLNWFPARKADWLAQRSAEYAAIQHALETGGSTLTGVETAEGVPGEFRLQQNYPNPFNPTTTISFTLPHTATVTLKVFNALGQEVGTLVNGTVTAGSHVVTFDATGLATGMYFYRLTSGDQTQMKRMVLVK